MKLGGMRKCNQKTVQNTTFSTNTKRLTNSKNTYLKLLLFVCPAKLYKRCCGVSVCNLSFPQKLQLQQRNFSTFFLFLFLFFFSLQRKTSLAGCVGLFLFCFDFLRLTFFYFFIIYLFFKNFLFSFSFNLYFL